MGWGAQPVQLGGSSPLSRGIPQLRQLPGARVRIIPALAGNTPVWVRLGVNRGDHPRSRGEYNVAGARSWIELGSSPLSRGIRYGKYLHCWPSGIIPALAGNTGPACAWGKQHWDHPRSRGEYERGILPARYLLGSSPLSRGIRWELIQSTAYERIIPALAGNTALVNYYYSG